MLHIDPWKRLFGSDVWRANEVSFDLNKLLFQVGWKGEIFGEKNLFSFEQNLDTFVDSRKDFSIQNWIHFDKILQEFC